MFRRKPNDLERILHRRPPSAVKRFLSSPTKYVAIAIDRHFGLFRWKPSDGSGICVVCVSDTHGRHPAIPEGDLLIHAGDLTLSGTRHEIQVTLDWLSTLPHPHKIIIGGNRDLFLSEPGAIEELHWHGMLYLRDQPELLHFPTIGRSLKIYGSPRTPKHGTGVFQYPRKRSRAVWEGTVPIDTDILITHGPPFAHLDLAGRGCKGLLRELWRTRPLLHVFGHIHGGHGIEAVRFDAVQEGFEQVCAGKGVRGLVKMVRGMLERMVKVWMWWPASNHTVLVNAAVIGGGESGLEQRPVREAIVVEI
ncbi:Metallo-dependent phosphatase-like protein [Sphaerosporella brunnea]|uniref:Metallo-dependent phosphatase-like protein n=1 Tax=Sphaerosporella brunnea TaxID=1250544 RepID=A0A5J5ETF9_9PEZI|nr:Metallo-dependent phosphatase-like protein [Sphaerosporella brunnea]